MGATSTYKTYLMHGTTSNNATTYEKLLDIVDFPDLGGTPEMLDTTTLSDKMKTFIMGIQEAEGLEFNANYDKTAYTALAALENQTEKYAVYFGTDSSGNPDGSDGKFSFEGQLSVHVTGAGVNEVRKMLITIAPTSEITFA